MIRSNLVCFVVRPLDDALFQGGAVARVSSFGHLVGVNAGEPVTVFMPVLVFLMLFLCATCEKYENADSCQIVGVSKPDEPHEKN